MKQVDQESRLTRWSRRKLQTTEETQKEDLALEIDEKELAHNETQESLSEDQPPDIPREPVLVDADMEPIESLTENSDFSKFMSPGVSDELRNLALRKMFQAPLFNIRDGLDEYDEDYTSFEKLGDVITADMRHQMEVEAEKKVELKAKAISEEESNSDVEEAGIVENETSSIVADDENLEQSNVELDKDEQIPDSDAIDLQSAEKMQQNNE
ncbi:MAG: DUF3306 domain-containing protein [Planctomycetota bacterium]